jgi:hypothetical protein
MTTAPDYFELETTLQKADADYSVTEAQTKKPQLNFRATYLNLSNSNYKTLTWLLSCCCRMKKNHYMRE